MFSVEKIRADFPILGRQVNGKPLVYFDNAASLQKSSSAIEAERTFYQQHYANVHRSPHTLGHEATLMYEAVRAKVRELINAPAPEEIIYTKGTTEGINLLAHSLMKGQINQKKSAPGDVVLLTEMEHHSNIVPWQLAGFKTIPVRIEDDGSIDLDDYREKLEAHTPKVVAFNHISNALGTVNPAAKICQMAKNAGAVTVVDGCQGVPHMDVDVQALDCDFYVFSGHKMGGPTGVGVVWGRAALLETMPPYQGGGEMIHDVSFDVTTYADIPNKFEAGTPNIAQVIGLGAAIDYMNGLDKQAMQAHESALYDAMQAGLLRIEGLVLHGTAIPKVPIFSFGMKGAHPSDIAMMLNEDGIAIRAGHHCCQPLMHRLGVSATARASLGFYNTLAEVEVFLNSLSKVQRMLAP